MAKSSQQTFSARASIGVDINGEFVLRRKIKRLALVREFKKLPPCIVGMEACMSAYFVSRTLRGLGLLVDYAVALRSM